MSTLQLKKGFTLIELLVVIAIIGILSGVVLTSLGSARQKANDAKVQATLSGARAQAELYASSNGNSYANVCTSSNTDSILKIVTSLGTPGADYYCASDANAWTLSAELKSDATKIICVDSTGTSKPGTTGGGLPTSGVACL